MLTINSLRPLVATSGTSGVGEGVFFSMAVTHDTVELE
jgi:hypothetical protein